MEEEELENDTASAAIDRLVVDCHALLSDLLAYQAFLAAHKRDKIVEIRPFRNAVASELKSLERVHELSSRPIECSS
jgi:hypothetical protein